MNDSKKKERRRKKEGREGRQQREKGPFLINVNRVDQGDRIDWSWVVYCKITCVGKRNSILPLLGLVWYCIALFWYLWFLHYLILNLIQFMRLYSPLCLCLSFSPSFPPFLVSPFLVFLVLT